MSDAVCANKQTHRALVSRSQTGIVMIKAAPALLKLTCTALHNASFACLSFALSHSVQCTLQAAFNKQLHSVPNTLKVNTTAVFYTLKDSPITQLHANLNL